MRLRISLLLAACFAVGGRAADPSNPQPPPPPEADVLFYLQPDGNRLMPLEQQTPSSFRAVKAFFVADFKAPVSPIRLSSSRPTFVIRRATPPDKRIDWLTLVDSVNGKRTVMLSLGPDKTAIPLPGKRVEMEYREAGTSTYSLRPVRPLAAGEYGFNFGKSNDVFLFGVDPGATAPEEPAEEPRSVPAPQDEKRRILDSLLQKQLITETDYRAKIAELSAPPVAPGPEDRLRKLDGLLKKGLISQPDYQKKRAEILAEI